ncbi:coilin-like isoform X2 [Drosophila subobscura]|uniref:coilin-like isoform X2 n=1 Tax=Drosophila subobscura TaxID=7241 RepID=UPI00155A075C|nr:coilin-like isoform X2 [Drosophila subobscura]
MQPFRIKVDLSYFFSDEREHAYVLINSACKNIEDLQHHIQNLFNLRNIRLRTNSGYFLPPNESLSVVKEGDVLKVFTFEEPPPAGVEAGSTKTSNKRKRSSHSPPWEPPKRSKRSELSVSQIVPANDFQMNDSALEMFKNASPLKDLPKKGDTILFKLRKIKSSLGSGLTGVITAISFPPRIRGVLRQYSLDESSDDTHSLMVKMSDMIEAKCR